jgi:hypothetical protein
MKINIKGKREKRNDWIQLRMIENIVVMYVEDVENHYKWKFWTQR